MTATKPRHLALYQFASCPFCVRVRDALCRLGLDIEIRDTARDRRYQNELVTATGKTMVPCLRIEASAGDVQWMHESADIIRYLEQI